MISFWESDTWFKNIDITIIGAGFTGLFAALEIRNRLPEARILIVERAPISQGASTRNAGFACFGSVGELLDDLTDEPSEKVFQRVERRFKGLEKFRSIVPPELCDYQEAGGYELFRELDAYHFSACKGQINYLNSALKQKIGFEPYAISKTQDFGFKNIAGAISIYGEGTLHPGKAIEFLRKACEARGIALLNGIKIDACNPISDGVQLQTSQGVFTSKKVIAATNAFINNLLPEVNVVPARGQVLVTSPIANLPFRGSFHMDKGFYYFRNVGNRVLLGGARNLDFATETSDAFELNKKIQAHLEDVLRTTILPTQNFSIDYRWAGIMAFGKNGEKEPVVEERLPGIIAVYRMGGMGVALSAQIADEAAALATASWQ